MTTVATPPGPKVELKMPPPAPAELLRSDERPFNTTVAAAPFATLSMPPPPLAKLPDTEDAPLSVTMDSAPSPTLTMPAPTLLGSLLDVLFALTELTSFSVSWLTKVTATFSMPPPENALLFVTVVPRLRVILAGP